MSDRIERWASAFAEHPHQAFELDDIEEIDADGWEDGDYSEETGAAIALLKDGRWASLEGGCDTTGWGCQSWFDTRVFTTRSDAWELGLTEAGRDRINNTGRPTDAP